mmetsp:Transcript_11943/g.14434  ORF Transcript_11943/g.14434 Transcript_11943/m.14434 type:complete len:314 (-) Transcript_11943:141-1082(-)
MRKATMCSGLNVVVWSIMCLIVGTNAYLPPNVKRSEFSNREAIRRSTILPPLKVSGIATSDDTTQTHVGGDDSSNEDQSRPHLVFPGGGIFFYWQAGAVTYLREQGYDLSHTTLSGASAGALTATLTGCNVDFEVATDLALDLAKDAGVWERKGGLQGIWGPMIESWLDTLLPDDATDRVNDRVSLLVTPVPSFGKNIISHFHSKDDLIACNMASVHLPWFLDGRLTSTFRDSSVIDGSFLSNESHYAPKRPEEMKDTVTLDWTKDPVMSTKAAEFVKVVSKDGIWDFLETGKKFAAHMEEQGDFQCLNKKSS